MRLYSSGEFNSAPLCAEARLPALSGHTCSLLQRFVIHFSCQTCRVDQEVQQNQNVMLLKNVGRSSIVSTTIASVRQSSAAFTRIETTSESEDRLGIRVTGTIWALSAIC